MNVIAVILNYNDEETAVASVARAEKIDEIDKIVLVDNHSTEYINLSKLQSDKTCFIRTDMNLGYAGGNNVGIKYAVEVLNADYIIIANPDAEFDGGFVTRALDVFSRYSNAGQVACVMNNGKNHDLARRLPSNFELILSNIPGIANMRYVLGYPSSYFAQEVCEVGQVWGSLLMLSRNAYLKTHGFDEDTFLYFEEAILGQRLHLVGLKTYLITNYSFIHHESVSISKTFKNTKDRMKIMYKSQILYSRKYLHTSNIGILFLQFSQHLGLMLLSFFLEDK